MTLVLMQEKEMQQLAVFWFFARWIYDSFSQFYCGRTNKDN